jgi:hypothetical protein
MQHIVINWQKKPIILIYSMFLSYLEKAPVFARFTSSLQSILAVIEI